LSELNPDRDQPLWSVFLRGMAMGAADIVPGVSGGTIAFITGIYFRLLQAISVIPEATFRHLLKGHFRPFWSACDGTFLLFLLAGVLASIATLAAVISYALYQYPILIWSFFFGLIVASVWHVSRQIKAPRAVLWLPFAVGAGFAWWVTTLSGMPLQPSSPMFLGAGALAICAMILPGISGSFILVLLGMYAPVLDAIRTLDFAILGVFAGGCLIGLLSVARIISWAFSRFHDLVLALLIGFMVGALNKVWPWKETLSWRINSSGEQIPLNEAGVNPFNYADIVGQDPQLLMACLFAVVGITLVLGVEWAGARREK
jgi:putative membrane protein